ncbi:ROK family protein [Actinoplanes siamensis]|uniref:Sugar kinase n=1 Tax=Actinoplanes siamensis TaxID=1223317 RepID=A0A919N5J3_9ACTN|nr:ROK family protein [Actinoplanes siamensis]GIF04772.1 sugar kinase [Actinoplanes siamensis]
MIPVGHTTRRKDLPVPAPRRPPDSAAAVLHAILQHGPVARSSVARVTRLSAATVTGATAALLRQRLIREVPEAAGPPGMGRPHVPLDVEPAAVGVIGVHVAVPCTTVALLDLRGRVLDEHRAPHGERDPGSVLAALGGGIAAMRREHPRRRILGAGLATGGWVDAANGTVIEHPVLGWRDVPAGAVLAEATGLPVRVDSNSRALLRAEQLFGAARMRESAAHLFVGNLVDVAFAAGGVVHEGPRSAAGAVAHLPVEGCAEACPCGRVGCLQVAVSERVVVRRALAAGLIDRPEIGDLVDAAAGGRAEAVRMLRDRARLVGRAAALLLDLFDPEVLVVAEAGVNRLPGCLATVRGEVAAHSSAGVDAVRIVHPSSFPDSVLAVAGGAVALHRVYASPLGRT